MLYSCTRMTTVGVRGLMGRGEPARESPHSYSRSSSRQ